MAQKSRPAATDPYAYFGARTPISVSEILFWFEHVSLKEKLWRWVKAAEDIKLKTLFRLMFLAL